MNDEPTLPAFSAYFASSEEGKLFVEWALRAWGHPLADDAEFSENLADSAADLLTTIASGDESQLRAVGLPADHCGLIAALWYVEKTDLDNRLSERGRVVRDGTARWVAVAEAWIRDRLPDPDDPSSDA